MLMLLLFLFQLSDNQNCNENAANAYAILSARPVKQSYNSAAKVAGLNSRKQDVNHVYYCSLR